MSGKALLVIHNGEDCEAIRGALTRVGLEVRCAESAAEAIERCDDGAPIDLLVADVLPDKGWTTNAVGDHLREKCPSAEILFTSTCPLNRLLEIEALSPEQFGDGRTVFLRRPLPDSVLLGKVWDMMQRNGVALSWPPLAEAAATAEQPARIPARSERKRRTRRSPRPPATFAAGA